MPDQVILAINGPPHVLLNDLACEEWQTVEKLCAKLFRRMLIYVLLAQKSPRENLLGGVNWEPIIQVF